MNYIKYIFLLSSIVLLNSCTEKIDIVLDTTYTRLVVEAKFSTDTTAHKVILTTTSSYFFNNAPPPVRGAIVTIDDGVTTYPLSESLIYPGVYETASNVYGVIGKTYHLLIKNVDVDNNGILEEYASTSTIYPVAKIDSIKAEYNTDPDGYVIKIYVLDPPTEDYYLFNIYKNNKLTTDTITEPFVTDDKFFNGKYVYGVVVGNLRDRKPDEIAHPGDSVELEMWRITKEFERFIVDLKATLRPSNPLFSGPPANVKGNINNGAVGYFATYSISRAKTVIK